MTQPICATSRSNEALRAFCEANPTGATKEEVEASQKSVRSLAGPAADAVKEAVHAAVEEVVAHGAFHAAEKLAESAGRHALGRSLSALGRANLYFEAAKEGTKALHTLAVGLPRERGEEIAKARESDNARQAMVVVLAAKDEALFPRGFVQAENERIGGKDGLGERHPASRLATRIQTDVNAGNAEAIAFRDAMASSVRAGLGATHDKAIETREALETRLEGDKDFADRFRNDPGFNAGVRAGVWQAEHDPAAFERAAREQAELKMTVQAWRAV